MKPARSKPNRSKPEAAPSADRCPVAALMGQAAQLLNARSLAVDLNDDHVVEQASDAIEAVTSLAATRQATSLFGAAFQLLICFSRVDASFSGPDLKTREHARRDVDRLLSSAYEAIVSAAGHRPDEIIVERTPRN